MLQGPTTHVPLPIHWTQCTHAHDSRHSGSRALVGPQRKKTYSSVKLDAGGFALGFFVACSSCGAPHRASMCALSSSGKISEPTSTLPALASDQSSGCSAFALTGVPATALKKPFLSPLMIPRTSLPFVLTAARSTLKVRLLASSLSQPFSNGPTAATLSVRSGVSRTQPAAEQFCIPGALSWSVRGRHALALPVSMFVMDRSGDATRCASSIFRSLPSMFTVLLWKTIVRLGVLTATALMKVTQSPAATISAVQLATGHM